MKKANLGLTLLEVLIAFAILSVSLGTIYTVLLQNSTRMNISKNKAQTLLIARSKLAELKTVTTTVPYKRTGITNNGYRWQTIVTSVGSPKETDKTRLLKYEVNVDDSVYLSVYIAKPAP